MGRLRHVHLLTRQVGAEALLEAARRLIHGAAASSLESSLPGTLRLPEDDVGLRNRLLDPGGSSLPTDAAAEIAGHWVAAGRVHRAGLLWIGSAGGANRQGRAREAERILHQVRGRLDAEADPLAAAWMEILRSSTYVRLGYLDRASVSLHAADLHLDAAESMRVESERASRLRISVVAARARIDRNRGNLREAEAGYRMAAEAAASSGDRNVEGEALLGLALVQSDRSDHATAFETISRSRDRLRSAGDLRSLALASYNFSTMLIEVGDSPAANLALAESESLARRIGDQGLVASCAYARGYALSEAGNLGAAREELTKAREVARETGLAVIEAACDQSLADVALLAGRLDEAAAHLIDAEQKTRSMGDRRSLAIARLCAGRLAFARHDFEASAAAFSETAELAQRVGDPRLAAAARVWRTAPLRELGRVQEALAEAEAVLPEFEGKGETGEIALALALVALARHASGQAEPAISTASAAQKAAAGCHDAWSKLFVRFAVAYVAGDRAAVSSAASDAESAGLLPLGAEIRRHGEHSPSATPR